MQEQHASPLALTRRRLGLALFVTIAAAVPTAAAAGPFDIAHDPRQYNVAPQRFFFSPVHGPRNGQSSESLLFEAQIAPTLVLWTSFEPADRGWEFIASATTMVRLRMLNQLSYPVRTPSYEPHLTLELHHVDGVRPYRAWGVAFVLGHHSNGQEACARAGAARPVTLGATALSDDNQECTAVVDSTVYDSGALNQRNGNFATNYVRSELFSKRLSSDGDRPGAFGLTFESGLYWQFHPSVGMEPELIGRYGRQRLGVRAALASSRVGLSAFAEYIADRPVSPRFRGELELHYVLHRGLGPFARLYRGEDYYNILFERDVLEVQLGIRWTTVRLDRWP